MILGQRVRRVFISFALCIFSLRAEEKADLEKISEQVSTGSWEKVLELTESHQLDPLLALLRQKARFELKKWDEITAANIISDPRFEAYDQYIRLLALYEAKKFEQVVQAPLPKEIPHNFTEYLRLIQAKSFLQQKKLLEAKKSFRAFLNDFPQSRFQSDVMLELANVEWELENKFEALHLFEKIYIYHPIRDTENLAPQRLKQMGRFENLDSGVHLRRIQTLQQAALFSKALKELHQLERISTGGDKERIRLAIASLEFARKNYSKAEFLARSGIKRAQEQESDMMKDWKSLLAFSLVRQGQYDKARVLYDELLQMKTPNAEKEQILLRLGLMSLDDSDFKAAENYFSRLRTEYSGGRYQESSHWFQSWSVLQQFHDLKDEKLPTELKNKLALSVNLLDKLPKLPQGEPLMGQALYWKARAEEALNRKTNAQKTKKTLESEWSASFYSLLGNTNSFDFLQYQETLASPELIVRENKKFLVSDPAFQQLSWRRLEAFVSVRLYQWAHLELENFMKITGRKNEGLRKAVAHRLEVLEDWRDLVRFAQRHFPLPLNKIKHGEELARYHYPQAYGELVLKAANEFQVSPFLIWGVMREESRFQADAVSLAGAVGLLQLMPNLANQIAVRLRESRVNRQKLTEPSLNIRYAAYHLRELIKQIQSWDTPKEFIFPLVVAAYNAGISPVKRWYKERDTQDLGVFVESIPYSETRTYVKRVIQSSNIYWRLYGEKNERLAINKGETKL